MGDCIEGTGFLLDMKGDCIEGTYDTLKQCAISKNAGGLGVAIHCIRSTGEHQRHAERHRAGVARLQQLCGLVGPALTSWAIIVDVPFDY